MGDEQRCKIKFGVWTYHGNLVDLIVASEEVPIDDYTENGAWELKKITGRRTSVKYVCCPDPFVDITYTLHMKRRLLFYGFNLILPCILVNALTILVFLLPADAGERITLGITVLLTMVVFLQLLGESLPPSDVTPLLGNYFACSIVMVSLTVFVSVISLKLHHTTTENASKMPAWIRTIFLELLPSILGMKQIPHTHNIRYNSLAKETTIMTSTDPVGEKLGNWNNSNKKNGRGTEVTSPEGRTLENILNELSFITDRMLSDDQDERSALEWRFTAAVMDKLMLYILVTFFLASTILTFFLTPGVLLPANSDHLE